MPPFILFLTSVAGFLSIKCNFLCLICVWLTVCSRNSARENPSWALFRHCFGKFNEPNYLVAVTLTFKKCCNMKCWKYFFNGRGKATTTEVHLHFVLTWRGTFYIIICEKSGYLESDIFLEHVQCSYIVTWTIVCKQLQSFSCWLEVVSMFHSILFPENWIEREKRSESWANRKWRHYKTCSLFFCLAWSET